jgi:nitrogen fixation protein FixH
MATYLIIIFFFGLVITGIVFLGIQEAAELSKRLAAQTLEASRVANSLAASSERGSAPSSGGRIV